MDAGRARTRIARLAIAGALAIAALFAGAGLESVTATADASAGHRAVIVARDRKATLVPATMGRNRGNTWFASLLGAVACALLGAYLVRAIGLGSRRHDLRRLSFRLRAPPRLVVAG
jgi:hypothetical protein